MKALVPANAVTAGAKSVYTVAKNDIQALRDMFTGIDGSLLFVTAGDWVISQGLTLRTKDEDQGLKANQWTHQFKAYAAEIGDADNPDIVRQSYSGFVIWNVDWLAQHFPEVRARVQAQYQTKTYW